MNRDAVLAIEVSQRQGGVAAARIRALAKLGAAPASGAAALIDAPPSSLEIVEIPVGPPDPDHDRLMPAIDDAMRRLEATPRELAAVVVSIGPGGFTGLRMAVACAKAMALALDCTLIAVPSAAVAARSARNANCEAPSPGAPPPPAIEDESPMIVALAGKGRDAWVSCVRSSRMAPCRIDSAGILDAAGLDALIDSLNAARRSTQSRSASASPAAPARSPAPPVLIADEHLPAPLAEVASRRGIPRRALTLTASECLIEGLLRWAAKEPGAVASADALLPLYPREPEAVRLWRERGRSAATA